MPKSRGRTRQSVRKRSESRAPGQLRRNELPGRDPPTVGAVSDRHRFEAIMKAAERSGLLKQKSGRIAGRISPALVRAAKRRTGIEADSDLIAFALANVALEDLFPAAFKRARRRVDADLKLGF